MSRIIKFDKSNSKFDELVRGFADWLSKTACTDGKISFVRDAGKIDRKATVTFTGSAWMKMKYLIAAADDKETAWHMVVHRSEDDSDEYFVTDILIFPQEVGSATVNTDQAEYEKWLEELPDDVFNHLRGHGHSHVNMGVTPSPVDITHQDKLLEQIPSDEFYLFMIWNKQGDRNVRLFDYKKNVLFESADVEVMIEESDNGFFDFINSAKEMVKKKTYSYSSTRGTSTRVTTYGGSATKSASSVASTASPWLEDNSWAYDAQDVFGNV